ncbi:uncharacterized protein CEXT_417521, partial [Caerostris extrusa]
MQDVKQALTEKPEIIPKIGIDGQFKSCQSGLHFNAKLNVCDYPDKAGCDSEIVEKPDKIPKIGIDGQCPKEDSENPVLLPHKNCTKFYMCHNGVPLVKSCQTGLHFNAKLNVCDYPDKAGCDS